MTIDEAKKYVETLSKKASDTDKPDDALKFSQAATNVANAMCGRNRSGKCLSQMVEQN